MNLGRLALELVLYGLEDMGLGDCIDDVQNIMDSCDTVYKSVKRINKKVKNKTKDGKKCKSVEKKKYKKLFKNKIYD